MLQMLCQDITRLVSLAYPSADVTLTNHVGKEAFVAALNDWHQQLEVMKHELVNTETALNCAVKIEAIFGYSRYIDFWRWPRQTSITSSIWQVWYRWWYSPPKVQEWTARNATESDQRYGALAARLGAADKGKTAPDSDGKKSTSPPRKAERIRLCPL